MKKIIVMLIMLFSMPSFASIKEDKLIYRFITEILNKVSLENWETCNNGFEITIKKHRIKIKSIRIIDIDGHILFADSYKNKIVFDKLYNKIDNYVDNNKKGIKLIKEILGEK